MDKLGRSRREEEVSGIVKAWKMHRILVPMHGRIISLNWLSITYYITWKEARQEEG